MKQNTQPDLTTCFSPGRWMLLLLQFAVWLPSAGQRRRGLPPRSAPRPGADRPTPRRPPLPAGLAYGPPRPEKGTADYLSESSEGVTFLRPLSLYLPSFSKIRQSVWTICDHPHTMLQLKPRILPLLQNQETSAFLINQLHKMTSE